MYKTRTLIILTLAAAAGAFALGRAFPASPEPLDPALGPESAARVLLAEASELCVSEASGARRPVARWAVGREAVRIAQELALRVESEALRSALQSAAERLAESCEHEGSGEGLRRRSTDLEGLARAGDRASRDAVVASYLGRLNEAASRAIEREEAARIANGGKVPTASPGVSATVVAESVAESRDQTAGERTRPQAAAESSAKASSIAVGGASRRLLERVQRWAPIFRHEAAALRRNRHRLQLEIDRHSMNRSRAACRAFGAELDRLDSELATRAPTRGLANRVERMILRYRRGAADCAAGRPASAFAHLNEGDREWAAVAASAAGLFHPRPMRPLRTAGSAVDDRGP